MSFHELTVRGFHEALAEGSATPGGGAAAAMTGASAAALIGMVCSLTLNDDDAVAVHDDMSTTRDRMASIRTDLEELADEDAAAFNEVMAAYRQPKGADRTAAIQTAMKGAADVPMETAERCLDVIAVAVDVTRRGNQNAVTDAAAGAVLGRAALEVALYNVAINLASIEDAAYCDQMDRRASELRSAAAEHLEAVEAHLEDAI